MRWPGFLRVLDRSLIKQTALERNGQRCMEWDSTELVTGRGGPIDRAIRMSVRVSFSTALAVRNNASQGTQRCRKGRHAVAPRCRQIRSVRAANNSAQWWCPAAIYYYVVIVLVEREINGMEESTERRELSACRQIVH
jgi:hypothetical protein